MVQTKESFELYLESCRQENKYGEYPKLKEIECPNHQQRPKMAFLRHGFHEHRVGPYVYRGKLWEYHCNFCGESFTTTESDTISICSLNLVE